MITSHTARDLVADGLANYTVMALDGDAATVFMAFYAEFEHIIMASLNPGDVCDYAFPAAVLPGREPCLVVMLQSRVLITWSNRSMFKKIQSHKIVQIAEVTDAWFGHYPNDGPGAPRKFVMETREGDVGVTLPNVPNYRTIGAVLRDHILAKGTRPVMVDPPGQQPPNPAAGGQAYDLGGPRGLVVSDHLPPTLLSLRELGEAGSYEFASTTDGRQLTLERGESYPLAVAYPDVSAYGGESWSLPDGTTVVVTDRRIAFFNPKVETGSQWVGFGLLGAAVATTATAVSAHRAGKRSAGLVLIGHLRYEWVLEIELTTRRALIGVVDTYLHLRGMTANGPTELKMFGRYVTDERFVHWLVSTIARHRANILSAAGAAPDPYLLELIKPEGPPLIARHRGAPRWTLPGDAGQLAALEKARLTTV